MKEEPRYPFPYGVVPRMAQLRADIEHDLLRPAARPADPVTQAVDDYLLMERKARAWDLTLEMGYAVPLDALRLVEHPAPDHSTR